MARPIKAFEEFPIVKEAYTQVREHLDTMIQAGNRPELGAIDPPLWHYIHSCVPDQFSLPPLGKAASAIGPRCKEMVIPLLVSGQLDPCAFATVIRDSTRFSQFIETWISRKVGSRVIAKKRVNRDRPEDNGQAAA